MATEQTTPPTFEPKDDWVMLSQGAEARIWKIPDFSALFPTATTNSNRPAIAKERFKKAYRHPILDEKLTKQRCRAEARILEKCAKKSPPDLFVPAVLRVEAPILYLEYLQDCITLRESLQQTLAITSPEKSTETILSQLANTLGCVLAQLHNLGVCHGDLTTSNIMINNDKKKLTLIDFGLAKNTESAEERAVDLYVLERALASTHPNLDMDDFWFTNGGGGGVLLAYKKQANKADATIARLDQVRLRGRKRECFG